jgi:hypothetical protein
MLRCALVLVLCACVFVVLSHSFSENSFESSSSKVGHPSSRSLNGVDDNSVSAPAKRLMACIFSPGNRELQRIPPTDISRVKVFTIPW